MVEEVPAWAKRYAVRIYAHQLLIQEMIEMLRTANEKAISDIYSFVSARLDRDNEISSEDMQRFNEEVRKYIGEVLSVLGPDAPLPL